MIHSRPRPDVGASPAIARCSPLSSARIASAGWTRPDRVDDELLGQVVGLGHDVAGALVVDPLEPLVAVHQHLARPGRDRERERQVVAAKSAAGGVTSARRVTASRRPARDRELPRLRPELRDDGREPERLPGLDARAEDEGAPAHAPVGDVDDPARRLAGRRALVRDGQGDARGRRRSA